MAGWEPISLLVVEPVIEPFWHKVNLKIEETLNIPLVWTPEVILLNRFDDSIQYEPKLS